MIWPNRGTEAWATSASYAEQILNILVREFDDLAAASTARIVRDAVHRHTADPYPTFECILDDPAIATWRLCADGKRVRLACFRLNPTSEERECEDRINALLNKINC
jgi:hypothetical protein